MAGGVRKQRGRWLALWREDGVKKSKILGPSLRDDKDAGACEARRRNRQTNKEGYLHNLIRAFR